MTQPALTVVSDETHTPSETVAERAKRLSKEARGLGREVVAQYISHLRRLADEAKIIVDLRGTIPDGIVGIASRNIAQFESEAGSLEALLARAKF